MKPLAHRPLVQRVFERLRRSKQIDDLILATSTAGRDDVLAELAASLDVPVHRGSEDDVLSRILEASHARDATIHVQCWGDCAFLDPGEIDRVVSRLVETDLDLVGNSFGKDRTLPSGLDVIAVRVPALEKAEQLTRAHSYHREHGTTYVYENPESFLIERLETPEDIRYPTLDLTINTEEDYAFASRLYDDLYGENPAFGVRDIIRHIRRTPELLAFRNAEPLRQVRLK